MRKKAIAIPIFACGLAAQTPIAPTPEPPAPLVAPQVGSYTVIQSFETGYRWSLVDGDPGKYRSDVNYGNGIRLLGSSLAVNSKDGRGRWFDELLLNTLGLGNDPYQSASLRAQKNRFYQYSLLWRLDEYYNPGLAVSGGLHRMDTRRRLQDHDLTILPRSPFQLNLGYNRNTQTGPALSSVQEFDAAGSPYPVFTDVRREWNEYRIGGQAELAGFRFTVQRRWDYYKDDSPYNFTALPGSPSALRQFRRSEPYHGSNPGWLGNVTSARKHWAINARMTYASGARDFALSESAAGIGGAGADAARQILVAGNARRPVAAGDFTVSATPAGRLTIVNHTAVHNTRIEGDSVYRELNSGGSFSQAYFRFLGVRTVANETDLHYRVTNWLSAYAGYHYSSRLIRFTNGVDAERDAFERSNSLHAGTAGFRIALFQAFSVNLEGEAGGSNRPLAPVSDRRYHAAAGRAEYRTRTLRLSAQYRHAYNLNAPLSFAAFSSHSRAASGAATWTPRPWFTLDASYAKLHLDTASGLAFFAGQQTPVLQPGYSSIYASNIHSANLGMRFGLGSRAELYAGYAVTRDTGDGRATAVPAGTADPIQALLSSVQTSPLAYHAPQARFSIRLASKARWNAGWQFYRYAEDFHLFGFTQNYRAHTGYTSVSWSF